MAHEWQVGQSVFVVYGGGKATYDATIEKVGRLYGVAKWGDSWCDRCEFVLNTGRERDAHSIHLNGRGHVVYANKSVYDEELRQVGAVKNLARLFDVSEYAIRNAKLSPACIDEIIAVIKRHEGNE